MDGESWLFLWWDGERRAFLRETRRGGAGGGGGAVRS